jgi:hypothetical protein
MSFPKHANWKNQFTIMSACFNYGKTSRSFGFNQEKNQAEEISFERIDCKWPRAGGQENFRAGFCVKRYFGDTFVKVQKP